MKKYFTKQLSANPLIDNKKSKTIRGKTIFGKLKQRAMGQNLFYFYLCKDSKPKLKLDNFVLHTIVDSELDRFEKEFEYCLVFGTLPAFKKKEEPSVS